MYLMPSLDILSYQAVQKLLWKIHKHYCEAVEMCSLWWLHNQIAEGE